MQSCLRRFVSETYHIRCFSSPDLSYFYPGLSLLPPPQNISQGTRRKCFFLRPKTPHPISLFYQPRRLDEDRRGEVLVHLIRRDQHRFPLFLAVFWAAGNWTHLGFQRSSLDCFFFFGCEIAIGVCASSFFPGSLPLPPKFLVLIHCSLWRMPGFGTVMSRNRSNSKRSNPRWDLQESPNHPNNDPMKI